MPAKNYLSHLECGLCGERFNADRLWNLCPACQKPLLVRYDLDAAKAGFVRGLLTAREPTMWRYRELLPLRDDRFKLCLGEGFTPLFRAGRLEREVGHDGLYIKDEGLNPTGSFKARGLAAAVSRAFELGVTAVSIPTAGNAGCAMSAYAALAGLEAHIFMPADVPRPFINECRVLGAKVTLIDGLITDCGKAARQGIEKFGRFDVSTLKEPYRIEGKKTMGYEVAEQMDWTLPDVIIYPTGGGTGLVGMWKAFAEMEALGWIGPKRPRMVTVQAEGCAPMVKAFHERGRPGRRDPGIDVHHGKDFWDLAGAGGWGDAGRLSATPEGRLDPGRRICRPFQYRQRGKILAYLGLKGRHGAVSLWTPPSLAVTGAIRIPRPPGTSPGGSPAAYAAGPPPLRGLQMATHHVSGGVKAELFRLCLIKKIRFIEKKLDKNA